MDTAAPTPAQQRPDGLERNTEVYEMGKPELRAVEKVIEDGYLFRYKAGHTAPRTARLEARLTELFDVKHALATSSGTGSLICALVGLGIGAGDEVIVPGYTFISTALAPLAVGAVPIIAEVDDSLTLDPNDFEARITPNTKAVIPVHMAGLPCNLDAIQRIARKHDVRIVEDAAQACGGSYRGRRLASIGDVGILSFNHYKILSCGEGGAVLTNDTLAHQRAMIQHDGGCVFFDEDAAETKPPFFAGLNFRVSEIQSAILLEQLKRMDRILTRLRARKRAMVEVFTAAAGPALAPVNDAEGDCAAVVAVQFPAADQAADFHKAHLDTCPMFRPIETDRHVYTNWEPIIRQRVHDPRMNPWKVARRKIEQGPRCCPATLDILGRTVCINTPYDATVAQARKMARAMTR